MTNFLFYASLPLFIIISVFLILLILIQKGRGGGLSSAFGGGGGSAAFGTKTGDVLTWTTAVVFGIFIMLAVVLNISANNIVAPAGAPVTSTADQTPVVPTPASPLPVAPTIPSVPTTAPATMPVK